MAAACVKTLLQPIDAVKTLQQYTQSKGTAITVLGACRDLASRPGGIANFYRGLVVTVIGSMPGVALYFGVYSYCKSRLLAGGSNNGHKQLKIAVSAAIGNSVASFSRVPYEVLKQQLQTSKYDSTWQALQSIVASEQRWSLVFPKGGVAIQMLRDVPYAVVCLLLYETLQAAVQKHYNASSDERRRKLLDFCVGGVAGGMGSWVTNPIDVVKTRLQTNSAAYGGSVLQCTSEIWSEGGPSAFLRGSVPRLAHKVPANALFFLFYEIFKRVLRVEEVTPTSEAKRKQQKKGQ